MTYCGEGASDRKYKLYRLAFAEKSTDRHWIDTYSVMTIHLAPQMMGRV